MPAKSPWTAWPSPNSSRRPARSVIIDDLENRCATRCISRLVDLIGAMRGLVPFLGYQTKADKMSLVEVWPAMTTSRISRVMDSLSLPA